MKKKRGEGMSRQEITLKENKQGKESCSRAIIKKSKNVFTGKVN